jgi:hypothetical protein
MTDLEMQRLNSPTRLLDPTSPVPACSSVHARERPRSIEPVARSRSVSPVSTISRYSTVSR